MPIRIENARNIAATTPTFVEFSAAKPEAFRLTQNQSVTAKRFFWYSKSV